MHGRTSVYIFQSRIKNWMLIVILSFLTLTQKTFLLSPLLKKKIEWKRTLVLLYCFLLDGYQIFFLICLGLLIPFLCGIYLGKNWKLVGPTEGSTSVFWKKKRLKLSKWSQGNMRGSTTWSKFLSEHHTLDIWKPRLNFCKYKHCSPSSFPPLVYCVSFVYSHKAKN